MEVEVKIPVNGLNPDPDEETLLADPVALGVETISLVDLITLGLEPGVVSETTLEELLGVDA